LRGIRGSNLGRRRTVGNAGTHRAEERGRTVLQLAMGLDIGGAETHVVSLSRSLVEMGWKVLVASGGGRRVRDITGSGIEHFDVPLGSRHPLKMLESYRALMDIAGSRGVDIIHAHARIPAWVGSYVSARLEVPLVTTYHGTFVSGFPWNLVSRQGDLTIAVSDVIKDYIIKEFRFDGDRITVIPNGIDCQEFRPVSGEETREIREDFLSLAGEGPVLVYASRMNPDLSVTACLTIEAACSLTETYPGLSLLIAGDGDSLPKVEKAAQEANRRAGREVVRCLGFVNDMARLYQSSDLVIGMSRVLLEAMACGKPCIVAGPQGYFGLVTSENAEELEERNFISRGAPKPVEPDTLASDIVSALSDPELNRITAFGLELVRSRHSAEATAYRVAEVYKRLL
jgi:glycosyltransferase involved in cell wall biosynthesis